MKSTMKKFLKLTAIAFLLLLSAQTFAATTTPETYTNLGFLQNGIWYSKDPFFDGDTVRIYSAVFNSSEYDLVGKVEFYDNGKSIGKTDFSVTGGGKIRDVWVDFTATKGAHKFSAKIIDAQLSKIGAASETIYLENAQTGTDTRTVEIDTTKNSASDAKDEDGNNNGASTTETAGKAAEIAQKMFDFAFNTAKTTINKINDFVDVTSQKIEVKKADLKSEIEEAKTEKAPATAAPTDQLMDKLPEPAKANSGFSLDSPFKTAYLFILTVLGFLLSNKTLFYIISAFVIYKILSIAISFLSGKIAEPKKR